MEVPAPMLCPKCRHLRRHGHINDYVFYTRSCDKCGKNFVSVFPPESDYIVYCQPCWFAEERNDKANGRNYDPKRSFFEQFDELMKATPQLGIIGMNNENCDFCESVANCRNCYLISESSNCEDSYFSYWIQSSKNILDCNYCHGCERCYELENCFDCFNLKYSQNCHNCSESYFLDNCIGCKNCLFSTNLRHKEFYIFNKPYTKEEYFKELEKIQWGNFEYVQKLKEKFQEFLKTQAHKHVQSENVQNSEGDYIKNTKNCHGVYHCYEAEDCSYGEHIWRGAKNCYDSNTAGRNAEWLYETTNSGLDSYHVKFSRYCWGGRNIEYCNTCMRCRDCFGCVSLKPNSKYCILNKQYTKEEYEKLVSQIKKKMLQDGEYGEFFPLSISLFGYNNTPSFDDENLSKEEVLKRGWKWEDQVSGVYEKGTIQMNQIQDIQEADDSILKDILTCLNCNKNYKLISQEFQFYKVENIPIPKFCPDCRLRKRLALHHQKKMRKMACDGCGKEIQTTLDEGVYEKILCDKCYLTFVY